MFFIATLAAYSIIRTQAFQPIKRDYLPLDLPKVFIYSTVLLVLVSLFLHRATTLIHRERRQEFRNWLFYALLAAVAFVGIQYQGMHFLVSTHLTASDGTTKVYGLCFTLALVHALHVIGGIGFLVYILVQSFRNRYDHERHWPVDNCASYWHFLDGVWLIMLATFLITR